jgi:hypothetical protein
MGFKTGGQQPFSCNYKARSAVNVKCGTPSSTQCITSTLTGTTTTTTTTTTPPTITLTINNMTSTSITYTIIGGASFTFPSNCSPVVSLVAANTNNTINSTNTTNNTNTNIDSAPYFNLPTTINSQNINIQLSTPLNSGTTQNNNTPFNELPSGTYNVYLAYFISPVCPNYFITNNSTPPTSTTPAVSGYYTYTV